MAESFDYKKKTKQLNAVIRELQDLDPFTKAYNALHDKLLLDMENILWGSPCEAVPGRLRGLFHP